MTVPPPGVVHIGDPDDPRLLPYRDIRERDLVGRAGRFVAEGTVVVRTLLRSTRFQAESILVRDNRMAGVAELLDSRPAGLPAYAVPGAVMDRVAGFHIHRGVLAIGRRLAEEPADRLVATLPEASLVVVAVGIANHDNLGSIFRNAAAFKVDAVLLDRTSCDPLYRKAIRVSVGTALTVPFARGGDGEELADLLSCHRFDTLALSPRGETDIAAIRAGSRTALFLGTEGAGLPERLMAQMRRVQIAMSDGLDSLNVAAASAIALHRLWQGELSGPRRPP